MISSTSEPPNSPSAEAALLAEIARLRFQVAELQAREQSTQQVTQELKRSEERYKTGLESVDEGMVVVQQLQNALDERETVLRQAMVEREAILNNTLVGISYNRNRCVEWVNDKYLEMTGRTRDEIIGKSSRMFYASDDEYEEDGRAISAGLLTDGGYASERLITRKNGELFWVELAGRCVLDKDPSAGVIWTMLDVSNRRQAEENIRLALNREMELNALRSRFVSMTSHEFRTPLATILSSTELMRYYSDRMSPPCQNELLHLPLKV